MGVGGFVLLMVFFIIAMVVYMLVVKGILFKKAGENPWKILIPVYGSYKAYDLFYDGSMFWTVFALNIIGSFVQKIFTGNAAVIGLIISLVFSIITLIIGIKYLISLAHSFDKSGGFAVGLIFLFPIFASILAFSDAKYGDGSNQERKGSLTGWRCECGNMNSPNAVFCDRCGKDRTTHQ